MRTTSYSIRAALAMAVVMFGFAFAGALKASAIGTGPAPAATPAPIAGVPAAEPAAAPDAPPAHDGQQPASGFAGEETCTTCHTGYGETVAATKHGFKANALTPAAKMSCESCHGPGQAHAENPEQVKLVSFKKAKATDANANCLTCHNRGGHALWDGSAHENRKVKCVDCHSVHAPKGPGLIAAKNQQQTCATCHSTIANRQQRFNHMPVREGKLECSSCHNVHGSVNVKLLKVGTTVDQSCTSCHTEKRGPFLWEHAPVADSCTTCHDSHGSNNDSMLVAKQPFLCQRCHVTSRHPPTVYEGFTLNNSQNANKMYAKGCANCHQQVHGSNHPNGKFLLR
jgi:DmsE family decaheme c-type cytochrome